jgi:protein-tyrosine phosphatase
MIDLHAHVLPGIDDGAADLDTSRAMLEVAAEDGTRVIAATPHFRDDHPLVRPEEIAASCREVEQAAAGTGVELVPGGEVDIAWSLAATPDELRLASYGGRGTDLLVETPYGELPGTFEELLFRLRALGFRILLAHPELSPSFQSDPARLAELVRAGTLLQVTARSLTKEGKSGSRRLAERLVTEGLAHVLASDAHSPGPWRPPVLSAGVAAVEALAPGRGAWMAEAVPAAILAGEPLPAGPPLPRPGRGPFRRLFARS